MVVRFLPGYEPVLKGWRDGCCLACQAKIAQTRAMQMTREEQEEAVLDELRRDPDATIEDLELRTGSRHARKVRMEAVRRGIATPIGAVIAARKRQRALEWRAKAGAEAEAKADRSPGKKQADALRAVREAVAADPGCTVAALVQKLTMPNSTVRRHLWRLVESGEVEARGPGHGTTYWPTQ